MVDKTRVQSARKMCIVWDVSNRRMVLRKRKDERGDNMTKREFLDTVFALAPNEANAIMDAFDEYVESNVVPTGRSGKERRMSKYIIDTETWANLFEVQRVGVYGIGNDIVTDEKTVWSRMFSLDELEELNSDYINEHYGSLQDEAYQAGLDKAWEIARRIRLNCEDGGIDCDGLRKMFGTANTYTIIKDNTASEAVAKIKAYDNVTHSDRIEVGDEVIWKPENITLIVTSTYEASGFNWCDGLAQDGKVYRTLIENDRKTGKHYDIQSVLEAMRK